MAKNDHVKQLIAEVGTARNAFATLVGNTVNEADAAIKSADGEWEHHRHYRTLLFWAEQGALLRYVEDVIRYP